MPWETGKSHMLEMRLIRPRLRKVLSVRRRGAALVRKRTSERVCMRVKTISEHEEYSCYRRVFSSSLHTTQCTRSVDGAGYKQTLSACRKTRTKFVQRCTAFLAGMKGVWWMPRFQEAMKDVIWLRYARGRCQIIVISRDFRMRKLTCLRQVPLYEGAYPGK